MTKRETVISKDLQNKKLTVVRAFDAGLERVWKAWTESEILDQWWAPKPYRAQTKVMDFREGGFWLYAMIGPKGDISWSKENFKKIDFQKRITNFVFFCDEEGIENNDFPKMYWDKEFSTSDEETTVVCQITFDKTEDLEKLINMGFEEGFKMGLANLDEYLGTKTLSES
jgi:PhnB protein